MDPENRNIIKLIRGCRKHDRESQRSLYKLYYSYCMSICMQYSQSREDAVEILNDGFMSVFTYIDKFNTDRLFKPWLRKVMINSAIDHNKKHLNHQEMESLDPDMKLAVEETNLDSVSYDDLLEMIRKLPPAYGTVFNMRAIEGYKHEEVAELLGISVGTSKSNFAKAKAKLQEYLADYFGVKP